MITSITMYQSSAFPRHFNSFIKNYRCPQFHLSLPFLKKTSSISSSMNNYKAQNTSRCGRDVSSASADSSSEDSEFTPEAPTHQAATQTLIFTILLLPHCNPTYQLSSQQSKTSSRSSNQLVSAPTLMLSLQQGNGFSL